MALESLPYRPCAGVALFNRAGLVLIGRRKGGAKAEEGRAGFEWQMPQGGIDEGEGPLSAARRELFEETNVASATLLAEARDWLKYDLPPHAGRWRGRYRGQTQKWFAFRFEGEESEIDIHRPAGGAHAAEFDAWRWERLEKLPALVIPFKRGVYEAVAQEFRAFAG